eukprot:NODE_2778_length_448_cov_341.380952_g2300_i0.p1 GENE.NODE_2778_length_448_cov_341.380952_g2300_i0~~NODE_2778_length_448_cov_341.380952_g2300_i0.p1  ORF type:complete len:130 (-),score=15.64 NODE_2778_length_448_cov_341.380952_g2300_i0:57-422(-)
MGVPKVAQNTVLLFDFAETFTMVSIVRFELLSAYGTRLRGQSLQKHVNLYTTETRPPIPAPNRAELHQRFCQHSTDSLANLDSKILHLIECQNPEPQDSNPIRRRHKRPGVPSAAPPDALS